ncbi:hypothetical protein ACWD6N_36330 [Micromonospora sp. NPDC005163]
MRVRYFEGWLAHLLAGQQWVSIVARFTEGGPKPVGLAADPRPGGVSVMVQMARGGTNTGTAAADAPGTWPGSSAEVEQVAVPRAPESSAEWAEAIAAVVAGTHHPDVKDVATYGVPVDGKRRPGVRVSFTDGSDIFTTVLDPQ